MNKSLNILAAIAAVITGIFFMGTLIYFAVDVFALYSENQFTGRMRSFDIEYWNAVGGAAVILVPLRLVGAINKKAKQIELERASKENEEEIFSALDAAMTNWNSQAAGKFNKYKN